MSALGLAVRPPGETVYDPDEAVADFPIDIDDVWIDDVGIDQPALYAKLQAFVAADPVAAARWRASVPKPRSKDAQWEGTAIHLKALASAMVAGILMSEHGIHAPNRLVNLFTIQQLADGRTRLDEHIEGVRGRIGCAYCHLKASQLDRCVCADADADDQLSCLGVNIDKITFEPQASPKSILVDKTDLYGGQKKRRRRDSDDKAFILRPRAWLWADAHGKELTETHVYDPREAPALSSNVVFSDSARPSKRTRE
jgi:hypothetical protein